MTAWWKIAGILVVAGSLLGSGSAPGQPAKGKALESWKRKSLEELEKATAQLAAFSGDGQLLALGERNLISLWDTATGKQVASFTLPASRKRPLNLSFAADGKLLAVSSAGAGPAGEFVDVLDTTARGESMLEEKPLRASFERYLTGFFAPDGKKLHLISTPKGPYLEVTFHEWLPATGKAAPTKLSAANIVATRGMNPAHGLRNLWLPQQDSFARNDAGDVFAIVNRDNFNFYDLDNAAEWFNAYGGIPGGVEEPAVYVNLAFVPRSDVLAIGSQSGGVYLARTDGNLKGKDWTIRAGDPKAHAVGKPPKRNPVLSLRVTPDRGTLLSIAADGTLVAHDVAEAIKQLEVPIKPNKNGTIVSSTAMQALKPLGSVPVAKNAAAATVDTQARQLVVIEMVDKTGRPRLWVHDHKE